MHVRDQPHESTLWLASSTPSSSPPTCIWCVHQVHQPTFDLSKCLHSQILFFFFFFPMIIGRAMTFHWKELNSMQSCIHTQFNCHYIQLQLIANMHLMGQSPASKLGLAFITLHLIFPSACNWKICIPMIIVHALAVHSKVLQHAIVHSYWIKLSLPTTAIDVFSFKKIAPHAIAHSYWIQLSLHLTAIEFAFQWLCMLCLFTQT